VAGTVYNVDAALGQSGIIGIKTGSGLNSGANFLFAAAATVDGHQLTLYGCVMGQPTLETAFEAAQALIGAARAGLQVGTVIAHGNAVGAYDTPWGSRSDLVATIDVTLVEWPGMMVRQQLNAPALVIDHPIAGGTAEGTLHIVIGDQQTDVPLVTASPLDPPGTTWRLFRIGL
jgi:D-alanyl-D-alanine carboxypeptidase (penicillin-binding protein 5/6)